MAASSLMMLSLLLLSITSHHVLAAPQQQPHTINVHSLMSSTACRPSAPGAPDAVSPASRPEAGSSTLQIVRRACLQPDDHKIPSDHYSTVLRRDHYRVRSIHRRLAGQPSTTTTITIPAHLGLPFNSDEYVVTVGIGTPPQNMTVLFDTGSDLTWVQCAPCAAGSCYPQEEPLFDRRNSTSYAAIPCGTPECHIGGGQETSCGGSSCAYTAKYGDESQTSGSLAKETVTLSPAAPPAAGVVFGCSDRATGFLDTRLAGLLGLGRGESSILSQTRKTNGGDSGVFSYCLPPRGSSTGYLTIGAAPQPPSNMMFTPLKTNADPRLSSMYVVDLAGISVNGAAIGITDGAFSAGAVVDSGTVVTHMPAAAYKALRDAFRSNMGGYTMLPAPEGSVAPLDTCYNVTGHDTVTVPRVALELGGGARVDVDASGILVVAGVEGQSLACLAFSPTDSAGLVIIGNMQQRGYNVVFDVGGGRVGFGPNGCS